MISVRNVKKSFKDQEVLKGVNLEIPKGEITMIIGQSGQGKSVLLKILMDLIEPDSGEVLVEGVNPLQLKGRQRNELNKRFGMLFQGGALFDSMTVEQNVSFPLQEHTRLRRSEIQQKVRSMLADVGLPNILHKMPSELSGGMRKRVALARALILEPEIMLYDEPTTGLDPLLTDSVDRLILETQQRLNITTVVVSHDIHAVFKIADRVAMLHQGVILEAGPPEVIQNSKKAFVQQFLAGKAQMDFVG